MPRSIVPTELQGYVDDWRMSAGLEHEGFIFMAGVTVAAVDGSHSGEPREQIVRAFDKVESVLREAGLGFEHLVEMTSYYVGLRNHLQTFKDVRAERVREPFPAWTAIEVAGFVREGAVIELRYIARRR